MVTAKDKLRRLLGHDETGCRGLRLLLLGEQPRRSPKTASKTVELVGMLVPSVYSAELSEFVFAAG